MITRCAYCGAFMSYDGVADPPGGPPRVSHGICAPCFKIESAKLDARDARLAALEALREKLKGRYDGN